MNHHHRVTWVVVALIVLCCCWFGVNAASIPESTLSACELLKIKQGEWGDVKRAVRESSLLIKGIEQMKLSKSLDEGVSEASLNEENLLAQDTLKEYQRLDKVLNVHVSALQLLCKNEPTPASGSVSNSGSLSESTSIGSSTIKTSSISNPTPTVQYVETKLPAKTLNTPSSQGALAEPELVVDEPGVDVVDNAIIAGGGLKSCLEYKQKIASSTKSGKYWINTGTEKFIVYCMMEPRSGDNLSGWTLISSRSALYEPIVIDSVVMGRSYKGETINKARFEFLKKNAKTMMFVNSKNTSAIADLAYLSKGNCVALNDISKRMIFHQEKKDCDLLGNDFCFVGLDKPGGSAQINTNCSLFRGGFNTKEVNKELDIYVR